MKRGGGYETDMSDYDNDGNTEEEGDEEERLSLHPYHHLPSPPPPSTNHHQNGSASGGQNSVMHSYWKQVSLIELTSLSLL